MKHSRLLIALLFLLVLAACDTSKPESAVDYNNKIVDIQYAVLGSFDEFIEAVDASDSLAAGKALETALDTAKASTAKLAQLEGFDGSTALRDNAKALIDFYVTSLDNDYRKIYPILVNENATLAQLMVADSIKDAFVLEEDALYNKLVETQTQFALKYKFDLATEPE